MDTDRVSNWLHIVANFGILAGLLLVALQMKQASNITRAELGSEGLIATMVAEEMIVGENFAQAWGKAMHNSPDLTDAELVQIHFFLIREWTSAMRLADIYTSGFSDSAVDSSTVEKWVFYLGNDTALRWWNAMPESSRKLNAPLYDAVQSSLSGAGPEHHEVHLRLLETLRAGRVTTPN